jgi:predicted enzyme related to lactoylglutathione lyase
MFQDTATFFSISVDDLQRAQDFYSKILGLPVERLPQGLSISLHGGGKMFAYLKQDHAPATFTVLNFKVQDLEGAVAELKKRGVAFEHYDQGHVKTGEGGIARGNGRGPDIAWFKDPAGNFISVLTEH